MIYKCLVCEYIYNESEGCQRSGVSAGTSVSDLPEDWACPDCGVDKEYLVEYKDDVE